MKNYSGQKKYFIKGLEITRWLTSVGFFFLALMKTRILLKFGLEPYELVVSIVGLPLFVSYYGIVAIIIEFSLAIGLWIKNLYAVTIIFAGSLTLGGVIISVAFIMFKLNAECGCGLLGDSEWGLLIQKLLIIIILGVLYKSKNRIFTNYR